MPASAKPARLVPLANAARVGAKPAAGQSAVAAADSASVRPAAAHSLIGCVELAFVLDHVTCLLSVSPLC